MSPRTVPFAAALLLAAAAPLASALAEAVELRLTDGRTLRGTIVESRSNAGQIVLELRTPGITIRRRIARDLIVGDPKVIPAIKTNTAPAAHPQTPPNKSVPIPPDDPAPESLPLAQLLARAEAIRTTGTMDWDSLRVTLRGVNERGDAVPLFGTLTVRLWGQKRVVPESNVLRHPFVTEQNYGSRFLSAPSQSIAYQHPYVLSPNPVVELGCWTRRLGGETRGGALDPAAGERLRLANTWGSTGHRQEARVGSRQDGRRAEPNRADTHDDVVLLPLQRPLPDHDHSLGAFGEVTVELSMPGVGVFEASAPDVVLSRQSLLRRERLYRDGSRFFPNEITTDSPQTTRSRNRFTWPGGVSGPERGILPIQP